MATIDQILGFRNLTGVIQGIKSGIPNCFPPEFMTPGKKVSGNKAEYFRITGTRQAARIAQYGSPSQRRDLRDIQAIPVTLLHTFENQQWPLSYTIALTQMNSLTHDQKGEEQATYQSRNFKKLFANLRIASTAYCLLQGKIFYSRITGDLAPAASASGVTSATTIDFNIPANNTGSCNGLIGGWSSATAPIMTQILQLKTAAIKATGYELEHAFYDDTVPGYIGRNTEAQAYLAREPAMRTIYLQNNAVPNGFGGIKYWHPAGSMFFDYNGTNTKIGYADGVTFTPSYDPEWFEIMEGSYLVPTTVMPQMGADAATTLRSVEEMFGMFGYGRLTMDPATVVQYAGDTFLPVLKVPAAIYQSVVT